MESPLRERSLVLSNQLKLFRVWNISLLDYNYNMN